MKNFKYFGLTAAAVLLLFHIFSLDFEDLRFSNNRSHYLGIFAMILVGLSFLLGIIKDRKGNQE